jgi:hypothetical protein
MRKSNVRGHARVAWLSILNRVDRIFHSLGRAIRSVLAFLNKRSGAIVALFTAALAISTTLLWLDTKHTTELTHLNIVQTNRPWIGVDITLAGPLNYDADGNARVHLRFNLKNFGHSPAANVWLQAKTCLTGESDPTAEQRILCEALRGHRGRGAHALGFVVFPGENLLYDFDLAITREQIKNTLSKFGNQAAAGREFFVPNIVGCVDYQFAFEEGHHQTGFFGVIHRIEPDHPDSSLIFFVDQGDVPIEQLRFERMFFGSYAD